MHAYAYQKVTHINNRGVLAPEAVGMAEGIIDDSAMAVLVSLLHRFQQILQQSSGKKIL